MSTTNKKRSSSSDAFVVEEGNQSRGPTKMLHSRRGNSWLEGPIEPVAREFHTMSSDGKELLHLYLFILQDWLWCQMIFLHIAFAMGIASMIIMGSKFLGDYHQRHQRIAWDSLLSFIAVMANTVWLLSDIVYDYYPANDLSVDQASSSLTAVAKYLLALCILLYMIYFLVLNPYKLLRRREDYFTLPKLTRFGGVAHDFFDYEMIQSTCSSLMDLCWICGFKYSFIAASIPTLFITADITIAYASHHGHFIDMFHFSLFTLWLLANWFWGCGEMFVENPAVNEKKITEETLSAAYHWPYLPDTNELILRYIGNCLLFLIGLMVASFYLKYHFFYRKQ